MSVGYTLHAFVERITLSPRAYMQFHNPERQLVSLCEIQKTIQKNNPKNNPKQKSKNVMQLERQKETPALDVVGFLDFTCCTRFSIANEYTDEV